ATPGDRGVILSTGQAQAFTTQNATQSNTSGGTTTANDGPSNVFGAGTFDTSYLDIRFIPTGNILTIQFVFASEEYPEYVNSSFNDLVIIEVNGTRIPLSVATDSGSVSSINPNTNGSLYNDNTADQFNTEMDGFTATLSLNMVVNAGEVNRIRIGIADVGDDQWDSNLLIAADSLQTAFVANDDSRTMFINQEKTLDILANDSAPLGSTLTLTHINGLPVVAGQQITLPTGQVITVNLNGTISVLTDADIGTVSFSYTAQTSTGISDSAFVTIQTIPCFTRGTRLDTPYGPRRIEDLRIGDLVLTRDDGPRPIRWIGRRQVAATGRFAPVRIAAGVMGATEDVLVSPLHRVLVAGPTAELLFGAREVASGRHDLGAGVGELPCGASDQALLRSGRRGRDLRAVSRARPRDRRGLRAKRAALAPSVRGAASHGLTGPRGSRGHPCPDPRVGEAGDRRHDVHRRRHNPRRPRSPPCHWPAPHRRHGAGHPHHDRRGRVFAGLGKRVGQKIGLVVPGAVKLGAEFRRKIGRQSEMRSDLPGIGMGLRGREIEPVPGRSQGVEGGWNPGKDVGVVEPALVVMRAVKTKRHAGIGRAQPTEAVDQRRADRPREIVRVWGRKAQGQKRVPDRSGDPSLRVGQRSVKVEEDRRHQSKSGET
ncbi:MAG: choice-of-anchor L domain-containing protein, partial [Rhodobacteraceae bacterium]|nr:choice-of-anchor L domain-containing protein [Paracoccaceae bacterium]